MTLEQLFKLVRAHWMTVVALTVLGGLLALGWAALQTPVYRADATGTIGAKTAAEDASTAMLYTNLAKSEASSYLQWAETRTVAQGAIDALGLEVSPEELVTKISIENPTDTPVIRVIADGRTPSEARNLATAWVTSLSEEGAKQSGGDDAVLALNVTESAVLPRSPAFPDFKLVTGIGLVAGLVVGLIVAYFRGMLDRRLRTASQVESEFGVSVLATIPVDRGLDQDQRIELVGSQKSSESYSFVREAVSELRTNLQFVNVDDPPRTIVVTSPLPGDGKSTTTANLARSIASSGKRVVVIDGDLRRPTMASTFGLVEGVGLTDVLSGQAELSDVLQAWGMDGELFVLGAGKVPPNPSELLGSRAMKTVLNELSEHAVVLVDAPPLIPVTDAAVLSSISDGALVVVSAGKTNVDALGKGLQNLEKTRSQALGVVFNRAPRKGPNSAYSYGYGYYSSRGKYSPQEASSRVGKLKRAVRMKG